jgi:hypothetical protein
MKTIGVIGTAKNTGKTTTLFFLIKKLIERDSIICLTGIGYDGEEIDNITNLPKPRLFLEQNTFVATSEKCLHNSDAKFDILEETSFTTALGKIFLVKISEPGLMVIAGPNTKKGLNELLTLAKEKTKCDILLVDGSLNRISPMYILDKLIFTTGASRNTNIDQLVDEMLIIEKLFSLNLSDQNFDDEVISIKYSNKILPLGINSLVDENDFVLIEKCLDNNVEKIFIPGLISVEFISKNIERFFASIKEPIEIIFHSPIQLLLTNEFSYITQLLAGLEKFGTKILFKFKPELTAITINPFYPKAENFNYIASFIDKNIFLNKMIKSLKTPVFNIFELGSEKIFDLI